MFVRRSLVVAALAISVSSCADQPTALQSGAPQFLEWADTTVQFSSSGSQTVGGGDGGGVLYMGPGDLVNLEQTRVSFWAVRGETRSVQINYKGRRNAEPRPFLLLTTTDPVFVPGIGQLAVGDSALITVKVNTKKLLVSLEPTGLQFGTPGSLTIWYTGARHGHDDNDQYNNPDETIDDTDLGMFYREDQKHPWSQLAATQSVTDHSFSYAIAHFSDYAVAKTREWAVQW